MITAYSTQGSFDPGELYRDFLQGEGDQSGTVLLHHGRVKRPGKQVPDFRWVELKAVVPDVDAALTALAGEAARLHRLHRVLLVHRLGRLAAGDAVLLAIVSGATRGPCFEGCRFLVDAVKEEEVIQLLEIP